MGADEISDFEIVISTNERWWRAEQSCHTIGGQLGDLPDGIQVCCEQEGSGSYCSIMLSGVTQRSNVRAAIGKALGILRAAGMKAVEVRAEPEALGFGVADD